MSDAITGSFTAAVAADTDAALARMAAEGDTSAFEALYRRHCGRVHGVIVHLVGGQGLRAEDLTQEAFVRAWRALPAFRFESAVSTWLHRMAVTTALMELRSRGSGRRYDTGDDTLDGLGEADTAGTATARGLHLERAVSTLPARARSAGPARCRGLEARGKSPPAWAWRQASPKRNCIAPASCCGRGRRPVMADHAEQELRLRLKGLRPDIAPSVELWPRIATRLHERPQRSIPPLHARFRRWILVATAASMLLAIGFAWKPRMQDRPPPVTQAVAMAMAGQYSATIEEYAHLPLQSSCSQRLIPSTRPHFGSSLASSATPMHASCLTRVAAPTTGVRN